LSIDKYFFQAGSPTCCIRFADAPWCFAPENWATIGQWHRHPDDGFSWQEGNPTWATGRGTLGILNALQSFGLNMKNHPVASIDYFVSLQSFSPTKM